MQEISPKKFSLRQAVTAVEKARLKNRQDVREGGRTRRQEKLSLRGGYVNCPVRVQ